MPLALPPTGLPTPQVLSYMQSDDFLQIGAASNTGFASAVWPTANLAIFLPVRIDQARTYTKAWWVNGTAVAGNVDVGIYTISGTTATRVVASTAEAQATVSVLQVAATFTTTTLAAGLYYLAISCTSTSATFWRSAANLTMVRAGNVYIATTSSPLPSTATVITMATTYVPLFGISELAAI